ncbi:MAG: hypothetical protein R3231_06645 [bacterium]|nr:hypothetical protein [bacterium]
MENCVRELADHFLDATQKIFSQKGFCFSSAFLVGDGVEVIKLDLSTEERKEAYSNLVKCRFFAGDARYLIVIHQAWVARLSPFEMCELFADDQGETLLHAKEEEAEEALLVFISSRADGEVWQVPFTQSNEGVIFEEKQVLKSIVSENWMVNRNKDMATQLN